MPVGVYLRQGHVDGAEVVNGNDEAQPRRHILLADAIACALLLPLLLVPRELVYHAFVYIEEPWSAFAQFKHLLGMQKPDH